MPNNWNKLLLPLVLFTLLFPLFINARTTLNFNHNWTFQKGDILNAQSTDFDDSQWRMLDVPHDWAIEGPFDPQGSPSTGKLPWRGQAWYRKTFDLDADMEGKKIYFLFDGIMAFPKIYINGQLAGQWDYGYNSFYIDATNFLKPGEENVMAVHVDTREHESRWYPGAGIYRKVQMIISEPIHIPIWGTYVTTPHMTESYADISSNIEVMNSSPVAQLVTLENHLINPQGHIVLSDTSRQRIGPDSLYIFEQWNTLLSPQRWDIDAPHLYTLRSVVKVNDQVMDEIATPFGIRDFEFTADDGFHLNGRRVQFKGVNLHHDLGPLGAAFFPAAMKRQLEIMKAMGCNAIRTSHNMPAPELLAFCDSMGLLVIDESFDKLDAHMDFLPGMDFFEFADRQLKNFIKRDRNHPSIILWSVANEERYLQGNGHGAIRMLNALVNYTNLYDPTRPVTLVTDNFKDVIRWRLFDYYDVHAYNYGRRYAEARREEPNKSVIISESASTVSTRGFYELPLPKEKTDFTDALQISSYDLNAPDWAEPADLDFKWQEEDRFVAGEFVWTGFDYLGEPTPYNEFMVYSGEITREQASRSSYFGIVDLCGIPKDRYYLYQSYWKPEQDLVHVLPHWNWENTSHDTVPVFVYTNGDRAELFLNGRSLGVQEKKPKSENPMERYRLMWMDVPYEPGELKAVAYKNGRKVGEKIMRTAGRAAQLKLSPEASSLQLNGEDLCFILVEAYDENGVLAPLADQKVNIQIQGPAKIAGVGNGNPQSLAPFQANSVQLFYGKAMIILKGKSGESGEVKVKVSSSGLVSDEVSIFGE
jgi:beta-galactosidase